MDKKGHFEVRRFPDDQVVHCPSCESSTVRTRLEDSSFVYGKGEKAVELAVQIPVHSCSTCDLEFTDSVAEEIRHRTICRHQKIMTPKEVISIREAYGLSRSNFAELTRLGEASLTRWENGTLLQNKAYDSFLYLLRFPENLERLKKLNLGESVSGIQAQTQQLQARFRLLRPDDKHEAAAAEFELRPTGS